MADDVLTKDEMGLLDQLVTLINDRPEEQREGALVASYDYLVDHVNIPGFTRRDRMVLLSLFPLAENADDSSEVQKAEDVKVYELPPPEEQTLRQLANGLPFDAGSFILLLVGRGSTKWCKITSTGVICYTRD